MFSEKYNKYGKRILCVVLFVAMLTACGKRSGVTRQNNTKEEATPQAQSETGKITLKYDRKVDVVVIKKDTEAKLLQLRNVSGGTMYTLVYSRETAVLDKYGNGRMMEEVQEGDLAQAYVNDGDEKLAALVYSKNNWKFENSANWKFDTEKSELIIGKDKYYYSDDMVLLSEGEEITLMDLNAQDVLNVQGTGKKVLSVTVEQGHGFVKLEGIKDFIGGWVEIGKVIKPISEDMLIIVPEGNWDVTIVKDGYGGSVGTTVERNKEISVDFSDVAANIVRYGAVEFTIEPRDAKLYIAGREMDYSRQILLEYDVYKIRVSADGYKDYTGDLKVDKALVGKKITLEKDSVSEAPTSTPEATEGTVTAVPAATAVPSEQIDNETKTILGYHIKINSPKGANVYMDDVYVGVAPVSITKISGKHTLTFSKNGYVTKSYSVDISKEESDVTFELPNLELQR